MGPRVQSLAHCVFVFAAFAAAWPEATRADGSNCESIPQSSCLSDWPSPQLTVPSGIAIASPISVKPSDAGLAASTSLSTWRDYNANHLSKKVELSLGQGAFAVVRGTCLKAALPSNLT
jgi:hypothetical protein